MIVACSIQVVIGALWEKWMKVKDCFQPPLQICLPQELISSLRQSLLPVRGARWSLDCGSVLLQTARMIELGFGMTRFHGRDYMLKLISEKARAMMIQIKGGIGFREVNPSRPWRTSCQGTPDHHWLGIRTSLEMLDCVLKAGASLRYDWLILSQIRSTLLHSEMRRHGRSIGMINVVM